MKIRLKVTGMSCAACSARVERAVSAVPGVDSCSVNLLSGDLTALGDASESEIRSAVIGAGYGVESVGVKRSVTAVGRGAIYRFAVSLVLLCVLMYFSMGYMLGAPMPAALSASPIAIAVIQLILSLAVMILNGRFFVNGARGIINLAPNMDTLVSLGSLAAFGYSCAIFVIMCVASYRGDSNIAHYLHELYFESAAMILVLITVGKMLEARAKGKTTSAIEGLLSLAPPTASVLRDGVEVTIPTEEIKLGDLFVVRPGERIATDGVVVSGVSAVDESAITGESVPVDKAEGSAVTGATVNMSGRMVCRATGVGEDTVLSSVVRMVSEASATKAPIARLADKVSGIFVPFVMGVALVTLIGWLVSGSGFGYAIGRAISVLVISCPCALGLATPVAIMVGSGVGAKNGVLYKTAAALEGCGRVSIAVLDKTGTVTEGYPRVTDIIPKEGVFERELLSLAASIEQPSEHPLGRAVYAYGVEMGVDIHPATDFVANVGKGVSGKILGSTVVATAVTEVREQLNIDLMASLDAMSDGGKTVIAVLRDGEYLGALALRDEPMADALAAVMRMKQMGIRVIMLTGDNERTARGVAASVGIDEVISGVRPEGKEAAVRSLMKDGRVAMIGDGINDAPALARADVGIAVGRGTDIAIDSADAVLMGKGLAPAVYCLEIGRATLRNIKENLFWAFLYNIVGIPLAAGLFGLAIPPMFGAFAMSLSSFSVVINALRLNLWHSSLKSSHGAGGSSGTCNKECNVKLTNEIVEEKEKMTVEKKSLVFKVEGMMCPHCEAAVKGAVEAVEGVVEATASHKDGTVTVVFDREPRAGEVEAVITSKGYKVVG